MIHKNSNFNIKIFLQMFRILFLLTNLLLDYDMLCLVGGTYCLNKTDSNTEDSHDELVTFQEKEGMQV